MLVTLDGCVVHFATFIHIAGREKSFRFGVHRQFHVHELRKQSQEIGRFDLAGMLEWCLEWTAMSFIFEVIMDYCRPVERDKDAGHLILLGKLVQRKWDDFFLTVAVEKNLLAEAGIPKTSNDTPQISQESIFRNDNCAGHSQVFIGVRSIPDWLCDCAASSESNLLCHAGDQKSIFAKWLGSTMTFCAADWNDDQVILFESRIDFSHIHGLVVHATWAFHVPTLRGKLPGIHNFASFTRC